MNNHDNDFSEINDCLKPNEEVLYVLLEYKINYWLIILAFIILAIGISLSIYLNVKYNKIVNLSRIIAFIVCIGIFPYTIKRNPAKLYVTNFQIIKVIKKKSSIVINKLLRKNLKKLIIYPSYFFNTYNFYFISKNENDKKITFSIHTNLDNKIFEYIKSFVPTIIKKSYDIILGYLLVALPFIFVIVYLLQYFGII